MVARAVSVVAFCLLAACAHEAPRRNAGGSGRGVTPVALPPSAAPLVVVGASQPMAKVQRVGTPAPPYVTDGWMRLAYSAEGKLLAVARPNANEGCVEIWEASTHRLLRKLDCDIPGVAALAFSADASHLVAVSEKGYVRQFVVATGERESSTLPGTDGASLVDWARYAADGQSLFVATTRDGLWRLHLHTRQATSLHGPNGHGWSAYAISRDEATLAVADAFNIVLVDAQTGKTRRTMPAPSSTGSILFSADGKKLAVFGSARSAIFDVASGRFVAALPDGARAALSPNGAFYACRDGDRVQLLSTDGVGLGTIRDLDMAAHGGQLAFAPDGRTLAWADGRRVRVFDLAVIARGERDSLATYARAMTLSPNGALLAVTEANDILLWDVARARVLRSLVGHSMEVDALAFSPDGLTLASCAKDSTCRVWPVAGGPSRALSRENSGGDRVSEISFRGTTLSVVANGQVDIFDVVSGRRAKRVPIPTAGGDATAIAADGSYIAVERGEVAAYLISLATGRIDRTLTMRSSMRHQYAASPDGHFLAVSATNGVSLVEIESGTERVLCSDACQQVAFAATGWLAARCGGKIRLWDERGAEAPPLAPTSIAPTTGWIATLAWSGDGTKLAVSGADLTISIFSIR